MYEVVTFEMCGEWFADIIREDGVVLWTTDSCDDESSAKYAAIDIINEQYTSK